MNCPWKFGAVTTFLCLSWSIHRLWFRVPRSLLVLLGQLGLWGPPGLPGVWKSPDGTTRGVTSGRHKGLTLAPKVGVGLRTGGPTDQIRPRYRVWGDKTRSCRPEVQKDPHLYPLLKTDRVWTEVGDGSLVRIRVPLCY